MKRNLLQAIAHPLKPVLLALGLVGVSGCSSVMTETRDIHDTWYFTFVRKGIISPAPPTFDIMEFREDGKLRIKSSLRGSDFQGSFTQDGENMTLSFHVPEQTAPVELRLKAALSDRNESLRVSEGNLELVFCRQDRLLADDLAGEWNLNMDGGKQKMILGKDGSYRLTEGGVAGYYRLWRSNHGQTMTTAFTIPGEGGFAALQTYERKGNRLTLVPIDEHGPQKSKSLTFSLSK